MILTGQQIEKEVKLGNIVISPFNESQVNPNSYNYRLGEEYIEIDSDAIYDSKVRCDNSEVKKIPEEGMILEPRKLYLCSTYETLGSEMYVTSLIGKSSMGRLGLFLQVSADLGHQGEIHKWTLELRSSIPIKIYPKMLIGQVTFWKTYGDRYFKDGYYTKFNVPQMSQGIK